MRHLATPLLPGFAQEAPSEFVDGFWLQPRRLRLWHLSGDHIDLIYWRDGQLISEAYKEICFFMRDRPSGKATSMNLTLIDTLYGVDGWLQYFKVPSRIILTSAFRTFERNLQIEGAALDSYHPRGEATDQRIDGVSSLQLAKFAAWLRPGGIGWYPQKNFVHLDIGRTRIWRG